MRIIGIIIIIVFAWYLLGFIGRLLFPVIVNRLSKRMMNNFSGNQNMNFDQQKKKEGEVSIEDTRQKGEGKTKDEGEYIDYEEME